MFKFEIDTNDASITVTLIDGNPGPKTAMCYPRGGVVIIDSDVFTIEGALFVPRLEDSRIGKNDVIRIYKAK